MYDNRRVVKSAEAYGVGRGARRREQCDSKEVDRAELSIGE